MGADQFDVAIAGAGHNGLTCAAYLAAAGLRVVVLEKNAVAGGAAITEEFHPGFRNSVASYTVSLLNPRVIHDPDLGAHGLTIVERPVANFWAVDARRSPVIEMLIPRHSIPRWRRPGKRVASLFAQYVAPLLLGGRSLAMPRPRRLQRRPWNHSRFREQAVARPGVIPRFSGANTLY